MIKIFRGKLYFHPEGGTWGRRLVKDGAYYTDGHTVSFLKRINRAEPKTQADIKEEFKRHGCLVDI